MTETRLLIFKDYIQYLYTSDMSYDHIGRYIKHVQNFLDRCDSVSRSGYRSYRRNAEILCDKFACAAICNLLDFMGIGYKRRISKPKERPLEKNSVLSEKNKALLNNFILWLTDKNDFSVNTINVYYYSIKMYFEYANEFTLDNVKRFIDTMGCKGFSPSTIRLRMTALECFGLWLKKPIKLKRPKMSKKLDTDNIPTEEEYYKLLEYLLDKPNKDYYFFVKILALTGARVSEFMQMKWEDVLSGEVVLKGKGGKYRRFFFPKKLQEETLLYVKKNNKSGLIAVGRYGKITARGLSGNLKLWGKNCGIEKKKMHPHAFRHFFAKMYLKKTKDVVQLAEILGHGSVDTTRIYLQKSREEQRLDFNKNVNW